MSDRTFTLDEAQTLLPILESLLKQAINGKKLIEDVDAELQETAHRVFLNGGMMLNVVHLARRKAEREKAIRRVKDALAEIDATGVQVKDLDIGLLDFPCKVEGEILLLCWKLGEPTITHWHGTGEGFAARKPIDERIANAGRSGRSRTALSSQLSALSKAGFVSGHRFSDAVNSSKFDAPSGAVNWKSTFPQPARKHCASSGSRSVLYI